MNNRVIPVSLLEVGCVEQEAGTTPRSLAQGFVENRACLRAYVKLVDGIKLKYTKEGLMNDNTSAGGK